MQSKVSGRDLADREIVDFEDSVDDSDDEMSDVSDDETPAAPPPHTTQPAPCVRTTRKSAAGPVPQPSARGHDLLGRIADSLDPQQQASRENERASALFQSQQLILLQGQIWDLNQTNQFLRNQLDDSERRRANADRRVDQLQNQIYISSLVRQVQPWQPSTRPYREPVGKPPTMTEDIAPGLGTGAGSTRMMMMFKLTVFPGAPPRGHQPRPVRATLLFSSQRAAERLLALTNPCWSLPIGCS